MDSGFRQEILRLFVGLMVWLSDWLMVQRAYSRGIQIFSKVSGGNFLGMITVFLSRYQQNGGIRRMTHRADVSSARHTFVKRLRYLSRCCSLPVKLFDEFAHFVISFLRHTCVIYRGYFMFRPHCTSFTQSYWRRQQSLFNPKMYR